MLMKLDLHVHSKYSADCFTEPRILAKKAAIYDIGFAITDHDTTKGWRKFKSLAREFKIPIILGKEIKVKFHNHLAGELLLLFMQEDIKSNDLYDVLDFSKENDVLLVVPHPFDFLRMRFKYWNLLHKEFPLKKLAFEIFNARCYFNIFNEIAMKFAIKNNLAISAGSDAHLIEELGNALIAGESNTLEGMRRLIKRGRVSVIGNKSSNLVHLKSFAIRLKKFLKY